MRAKTRLCPECQDAFSPQGLAGHLRFKHGFNPERAGQVARKAESVSGQSGVELDSGEGENPGQGSGWLPAIAIAGLSILALVALSNRSTLGKCPRCGQQLDFSDAKRSGADVVSCPRCGQLLTVPQ